MANLKSPYLWWLLAGIGIIVILFVVLVNLARPALNALNRGMELHPRGQYLPVGSTGTIDLSSLGHGEHRGGRYACFKSDADEGRFKLDVFAGNVRDEEVVRTRSFSLADGTTVTATKFDAPEGPLQVDIDDGPNKGSECWLPYIALFKNVRIVENRR